jgi:hypothetical protein
MAKSSTLLQAGKHNETVALLLNYFPTIAHNSEDRAVHCLHDFAGLSPKKKRLSRRKWLIISAISIYIGQKKEYISLRSLAF